MGQGQVWVAIGNVVIQENRQNHQVEAIPRPFAPVKQQLADRRVAVDAKIQHFNSQLFFHHAAPRRRSPATSDEEGTECTGLPALGVMLEGSAFMEWVPSASKYSELDLTIVYK